MDLKILFNPFMIYRIVIFINFQFFIARIHYILKLYKTCIAYEKYYEITRQFKVQFSSMNILLT